MWLSVSNRLGRWVLFDYLHFAFLFFTTGRCGDLCDLFWVLLWPVLGYLYVWLCCLPVFGIFYLLYALCKREGVYCPSSVDLTFICKVTTENRLGPWRWCLGDHAGYGHYCLPYSCYSVSFVFIRPIDWLWPAELDPALAFWFWRWQELLDTLPVWTMLVGSLPTRTRTSVSVSFGLFSLPLDGPTVLIESMSS